MQFEYVATEVLVPQEITIPTIGQCTGGCGAYIVTRGRWNQIKREVRRQLRGRFKSEASRGACRGCYTKLLEAGDHIDLPTRQITDEIFAEEYNTMRAANMSDYVIRDAIGMSESAFDKALERGRKAGRVTRDRMTQETMDILPANTGHRGAGKRAKKRRQRL